MLALRWANVSRRWPNVKPASHAGWKMEHSPGLCLPASRPWCENRALFLFLSPLVLQTAERTGVASVLGLPHAEKPQDSTFCRQQARAMVNGEKRCSWEVTRQHLLQPASQISGQLVNGGKDAMKQSHFVKYNVGLSPGLMSVIKTEFVSPTF